MSDDLKTLVAQEVAKQLAAIAADQTTKKVLEFLKNRNSADAYVVETWRSGTEWYRVWSDGFIEQGGCFESSSAVSNKTISLPKEMPNADYSLTITADTSGGWAARSYMGYQEKTATSFGLKCDIYGDDGNRFRGYSWIAAGC